MCGQEKGDVKGSTGSEEGRWGFGRVLPLVPAAGTHGRERQRTMVKVARPRLMVTGRLTSPDGASKSRWAWLKGIESVVKDSFQVDWSSVTWGTWSNLGVSYAMEAECCPDALVRLVRAVRGRRRHLAREVESGRCQCRGEEQDGPE